MTPEERIAKTRELYPEYHYRNTSDILEFFESHSDYEKGKNIYWYYQNIFKFSPLRVESLLTNWSLPVKIEEIDLFLKFHSLISKGFVRYEKNP